MNSDTSKFLQALFRPGELVATYGPHPAHKAYYGPWEAIKLAEYITLNPLATEERRAHLMADYRNFLIESDKVSLECQHFLLRELEKVIPIRTITYSGGNSLHAIISLSDTLITGEDGETKQLLYTEYFKRLHAAITNVLEPLVTEKYQGRLFDIANQDASRLTRLAGATNRQWKDTTKFWASQNLISTGTLATAEQFETFLKTYTPKEYVESEFVTVKYDVCYNGTFERTLNYQTHLRGLKSALCIPEKWGGSAGNHPHIYRYAMWAIDSTGVNHEEFLDFVKKYTAPYLLSLGYPMWKIEEAVKGAYKIKRTRK